MPNTDPNAPRDRITWQRGKQAEFRIKLLNKDGTPLMLDTTKYPAFAIYAPSGVMEQQGVMQQFNTPGNYRTLWTVPTNAELSNDKGSWTFEVTAIRSKDLKQVQKTIDFNVVDKRASSSDNRNVVQLGVLGMPHRALWRGDFEPFELTLQVFYSASPDDPNLAPIYIPLTKASLTQVVDGDSIAYYYDVPANTIKVSGDYTLLWTVRETETSPTENEFEQVRFIKKSFIRHIPSLRFACERLPLDKDAPQKLSDADLVEALTMGAAQLNMYHPISTYTAESIPGPLLFHWLLISMRWMLTSQHLVLASQAFNFCVDEDTYIKTDRGLVKASQLSEKLLVENAINDVYTYMAKHKYVNGFIRFLNKYVDRYGDSETTLHVSKIFKMFGSKNRESICVNSLVRFMNTRGFQYFRRDYGRKRGYYVIDSAFVDNVKHSVLGMYDDCKSAHISKVKSDFDLITPIGNQRPKAVWDFGDKKSIQLRTALGIKLTATKNHPVLTLDSKLNQTCVTMRDLKIGDWVAVDAHPEPDSDWGLDLSSFVTAVDYQKHPNETCDYVIPNKMTPDLARVIGYILSEGYIDNTGLISFTNSDMDLIRDYRKAFKRTFGIKPSMTFEAESLYTSGLMIKHYRIVRKGIVRFLIALGMTVGNACSKTIPWSIMRSPKPTAASFIQAYFEGDGCYSVNMKADATSRVGIFSSCSEKIRENMQQLLLRFGIVSSIPDKSGSDVGNLLITGPSLDRYALAIGWFKKGVGHKPSSKYYPHKEGLPPQVLNTLRGLTTGYKRFYNEATGKHEHSGLSNYNPKTKGKYFDYYASKTTYKHVRRFVKAKKSALKIHRRSEYRRIRDLLKTDLLWSQVVSLEDVGLKHVFDPELRDVKTASGEDHKFSHLFISNSIVTHNSGQTVSLDYDQTGAVESAIGRIDGYINESIGAAKMSVNRMTTNNMALGLRSPRPIGWNQRVIRYELADGSGNYGMILGQLTTLGLIP